MATASPKRAGQRGKSVEEVVEFAVSHRIRSKILVILDQGTYTASELADIIGEPRNRIGNHIRELLDAGSIEIADTKRRRNAQQHYYRAVRLSFLSARDIGKTTWQERQITAGLVTQALIAELMSALWAGRVFEDQRDWLTWEPFDLDATGRQEVYEEQEASWERLRAIKARATARAAATGDKTTPYVLAMLAFERSVEAPPPTHTVDPD